MKIMRNTKNLPFSIKNNETDRVKSLLGFFGLCKKGSLSSFLLLEVGEKSVKELYPSDERDDDDNDNDKLFVYKYFSQRFNRKRSKSN